MNTRAKMIFMAVSLAVGGSALDSQAADQSAFFEQQREMTDGNYVQYNVVPSPARSKPATPHQIAEDNWLTAERSRGQGVPVTPFPVPAPVAKAPVKPATPYQAAENAWLTKERNVTDGNFAPVPFRSPASATNVAGVR